MSPPDSPDVAAERLRRGSPEDLDTVGVHAALTLGALALRGRKADDATAGSRAMARIFAMSAAERAGLALVDVIAVDLLEKDADAGSLMGLPWALSAVRGGAGELAVEQWRDVGELVALTGETVQAFLEAKGLADGWVGSLLDENARPLQTEELDADMRAMLAIDGDVHGLLVFDALLAGLLDSLNQPTWAAKVRATTAEARGERWAVGAVKGAGETVFHAVWAKLQRERAVPVFRLMHVEHEGSSYVQAPKVLGGIAWAFGTEGQRVAEPTEVVDGDEYRAAPKVARYVSRSIGLVPEGRVQQGILAVETTTEALAVRVLADSQAVVSGVGGKMALLLAVLSPEGGGLCRMTVDQLCRMLWPAAKRGPQLRDRQAAVKAALALRELFVVLPNTVNFRLWDIAAPAAKAPTGELPITFGWSKNAEAEELGGRAAGMLRGRFLLNLSGAMRLSADHALELRTYLHAAAGWNEARRGDAFDPKFAPKGTAEELAARVNALSAPAVQYLSEQGKGRRQAAADDKRRLTEALERLADEAGLIRLEKGGRGVLRLLPPGGLLEAYELMRKDGRRPAK